MINQERIFEQLGVSLNQQQLSWLQMMVDHKGGTIVSPAGAGKSYFLAVYAILSLLHPYEQKRIVVTAPTYRAARVISTIMFKILSTNKEIGPLVKISLGAERDSFEINGNICYCLSLGTGDKIRGLRPNILLVDNLEHMDGESLDVVIRGFGAINYNPLSTSNQHSEVLLMERLEERCSNSLQ